MNPLKQKQHKLLKTIGCEDLADKVNEIVDFINSVPPLDEKLSDEDMEDIDSFLSIKEDKNYIKVDPQDIESIINFLGGKMERQKIINYIRDYIKPIK
jgi:hypothetical protein